MNFGNDNITVTVYNVMYQTNLDILPFLAVGFTHDLCTVGSIGLATSDVTVLCVASVLPAQHCDGEGSLALHCDSSTDTSVHRGRHICRYTCMQLTENYFRLSHCKSIHTYDVVETSLVLLLLSSSSYREPRIVGLSNSRGTFQWRSNGSK